MNRARFVHDELIADDWEVLFADVWKVKGPASLPCMPVQDGSRPGGAPARPSTRLVTGSNCLDYRCVHEPSIRSLPVLASLRRLTITSRLDRMLEPVAGLDAMSNRAMARARSTRMSRLRRRGDAVEPVAHADDPFARESESGRSDACWGRAAGARRPRQRTVPSVREQSPRCHAGLSVPTQAVMKPPTCQARARSGGSLDTRGRHPLVAQ
jgi:hypothetical protein